MGMWLGGYALVTLVLAWVVFWGGAYKLQDSWFAELIAFRASTVDADGIKLLAWLVWIGDTLWFVWGVADPSMRAF